MVESIERCATCDRDECRSGEPRAPEYLAAAERILAANGHATLADREIMHRHARQRNAADVDCTAHRVDWRARAIAAESRIAQVAAELADDLATAQAEIDRAIASPRGMGGALPSMSRLRHGATPTVRAWLGRLVEKLRGGAVESDAAKDRDAAKWRKVEPMIERLREAAKVARHDYATDDDATVDHRVTGHELIDAAIELLAATKEPS